ncbi:ankyrin repeat-containing domain protein, partial [Mycena olivaceomarginata]
LYEPSGQVGGERHRVDSPLQFCVQEGYIEGIMEMLATNPESVNLVGQKSFANVLAIASSYGHADIVRLLLRHGAKINLRCPHYGSALSTAARNGRNEILQLLLENGAAADLEDWGNALKVASKYGEFESVCLLECGFDVDKAGAHYQAALEAACSSTYAGIV